MLDYDIELEEDEWEACEPEVKEDLDVPIYATGDPLHDMRELAKTIVQLRDQKKALEAQSSEIENTIESMSLIMHRMLKANQLENLNISGVGLISPTIKKYPKIVDQELLEDFFIGHDLMGMMKRTIHPKTLKSWMTTSELPELSNPSSIGLAVFEKKSISIKKGK